MNTMKFIGLTGALLLPGAAQALEWNQDWSDWEVRPRVSTGFIQYKYNQEPQTLLIRDDSLIEGVAQEGLKLEDTLLFAELGVSAFFGNFFIDLSFQKSDEGEDDASFDSVDAFVIGTDTTFTATDQDGKAEIDRQELSLSFGYAITDFLGVFAGYKKNETVFDQRLTGRLFLAQGGETAEADVLTDVSSDFDQDGYFLGATYVWPFESDGWLNGALSFDLGVAFLDGDFSTKGDRTVTVLIAGFDDPTTLNIDSKASGSAVGINLGMAWSGAVTERLSYTVGVNGYQYDYDGEGDSADFEDTVVRFSIGLSYAIDANGFR